jgi:Cohesin domain
MKNFLLIVALLVGYSSLGQTVKLYFPNDTNNVNTAGQVINKGDNFDVVVYADGNSNTSVRALYFDFEYTNTAFQLLGVDHTGTGGNGGIIPYGSQITLSHQDYPGYSWRSTQANNVADGNVKYINSAYNYTAGGAKSILRVYLNWSVATGGLGTDRLLILHFKLKTTAPGYSWDPIKMNFAAAFNQNGTAGSTIMDTPLTSVIMLDPTASRYINPTIDYNANVDNFSLHRVAFTDSVTNQTYLVDALSDGSIPVDQTRFQPNTVYHVRVMFNMDTVKDLSSAAVSVSDYTTAQAEFVTQNLDGTFRNQNIITGMGYYAADVNRNKVFDGGDLVRLFSQVTGVENLVTLPSTYSAGTDMYMSVPTFDVTTFNTATASSWKDIPANYVRFKTGTIGQNLPLKLRYVIPGDVNRSHSSQVVINNAVATNAVPSLQKNLMASRTANLLINTPQGIPAIDVSLKNVVLTSSTIDIPVQVKTNGLNVAALQFEFTYDPTKIKFEQIFNELPNTWYTFVDNKEGKVKFGSLDKEAKNPITGELIPFKLRFSTVVNPLDINSYIRVTPNMDAASKTGYQLGINLSTDSIKLTGYNNF